MFPQLPAAVRVFLCTRATDMRKSFDGLLGMVRESSAQVSASSGGWPFRRYCAVRPVAVGRPKGIDQGKGFDGCRNL